MGIVSQRIDSTGIEIVWSDGGRFAITKAEWLALVAAQGSRAKALQALRSQLQAVLGADPGRGHIGQYTVEFDADGFPMSLEYDSR